MRLVVVVEKEQAGRCGRRRPRLARSSTLVRGASRSESKTTGIKLMRDKRCLRSHNSSVRAEILYQYHRLEQQKHRHRLLPMSLSHEALCPSLLPLLLQTEIVSSRRSKRANKTLKDEINGQNNERAADKVSWLDTVVPSSRP